MSDVLFYLVREKRSDSAPFTYALLARECGQRGHVIIGQNDSLEVIAQTHAKMCSPFVLMDRSQLCTTSDPIGAYDRFAARESVDESALTSYWHIYLCGSKQ